MTDTKSSKKNNSSENSKDKIKSTAKTTGLGTTKVKKPVVAPPAKNKNKVISEKIKIPLSKIALLALVLSISSLAAIGGGYFWLIQQQEALADQLQQSKVAIQQESKQKTQQVISEYQTKVDANIQQVLEKSQVENHAVIAQLTASIARIDQKQPSDWLVHEAEYLIRVAARTMWLERDTRAAISLLEDANLRLQELNSPKYLLVRQSIHQDIEALKLLPVLDTNEVVLILMALNNQVNELPLSMVNLKEVEDVQADLTLSEDMADWQSNLQKTWRKFLNDFITVRRRSGSVEPLMSPSQQQNLRQNLSLKIHLSLWAASEEKSQIYQASLNDITQWLSHYFDMESEINKNFYQRIESLKSMLVSFNYPSDLSSLSTIRALLTAKIIPSITIPSITIESDTTDNTIEEKEKPVPVQLPVIVEETPTKKKVNDTENEGSL